jgi:hypothetical protein
MTGLRVPNESPLRSKKLAEEIDRQSAAAIETWGSDHVTLRMLLKKSIDDRRSAGLVSVDDDESRLKNHVLTEPVNRGGGSWRRLVHVLPDDESFIFEHVECVPADGAIDEARQVMEAFLDLEHRDATIEHDVDQLDDESRWRVYSQLRSHAMESWSGKAGEIHPRWQAAVDDARRALEQEQDPALRRYWEWALAVEQDRLEIERGRLEERDD